MRSSWPSPSNNRSLLSQSCIAYDEGSSRQNWRTAVDPQTGHFGTDVESVIGVCRSLPSDGSLDASSSVVPFDELPLLPPSKPDMKFACPVCLKEFYFKNHFREHYRIHTGERPFPCPYCPYRARQGKSFKAHLTSVHGVTNVADRK